MGLIGIMKLEATGDDTLNVCYIKLIYRKNLQWNVCYLNNIENKCIHLDKYH